MDNVEYVLWERIKELEKDLPDLLLDREMLDWIISKRVSIYTEVGTFISLKSRDDISKAMKDEK